MTAKATQLGGLFYCCACGEERSFSGDDPHAELYQMFTDAEALATDERLPADVRQRLMNTALLIRRRVAEANLTIDQLETLSRVRTAIKTAAVKFAARHGLTAKFPNG